MNTLDKQYQALLQDILDNGVPKQDRTGTGTLSVFGRQIRHKMSDGFPLLTTKKMAWKSIVTELLWFLRGDTNIKYLVDNGCHIWDGDAYKNYDNIQSTHHAINEARNMVNMTGSKPLKSTKPLSQEEFINKIKTDDEFANKWGELGPIYGKQWRKWGGKKITSINLEKVKPYKWGMIMDMVRNGEDASEYGVSYETSDSSIDQIANLISELKTNPDSRRLMVSAWNVGELDQMVLPPCHYGFQIYTRELILKERFDYGSERGMWKLGETINYMHCDELNIPTRAISLMWNQRSVDTFLGLPFNIASYGLLLEIIAKEVNMVPDELIGNLGDVHLYSNHIEQAKEQISREPFELPTLVIEHSSLEPVELIHKLENYQSHSAIKAPLSN